MKKSLLFFILITFKLFSQENSLKIDTLEFQIGYPTLHTSAIQQLQAYPSPRYTPNNSFIRLFNWMNSKYMAGGGQPGIKDAVSIPESVRIQEELILHWNYFLTLQNSGMAQTKESYNNPKLPLKQFIDLANKYPEVPLAVTTFWLQLSPKRMGLKDDKPAILKKDYPNSFYIKDASRNMTKKILNFAAPDSIFMKDGNLQKICLQNILSHLTRPINMINENGEEGPGPQHIGILSGDKDMIADKNKLGITNWSIYAAQKKKQARDIYSAQFLKLPELKNTWFTVYAVEGGPINRFNWETSKSTCSKIKGNYYSTSDFYPRTPDNWKTWKGAWHGWKWINDGRKVEIKSGDKFFSPFVSAGWAYNPEKDMRPAQWLGLLKCLGVVGAEFYYSGYFNLKAPYSLPENYVWQAAIPAYAQAITTHYADVFFNGNVLFDVKNEPIITYPVKDNDIIVAVRKQDEKEKYVIAATVQPSSNTEKFPLQKNVEITIAGENIKIEARRQGSVYIYDRTVSPALFYQLDRWHQYEHPSRWRKYWINEAEVFDTSSSEENTIIKSIYLKSQSGLDFSNAESYIQLNKQQWVKYNFSKRDAEHLAPKLYVLLYVKCATAIQLNLSINGKEFPISNKKTDNWEWIKLPIETILSQTDRSVIKLQSLTDGVLIDKIIINDSPQIPDLKNY
ncbi:hypothetical protein BH10BAC1_BH10BAC1_17500 [soil metagenome]